MRIFLTVFERGVSSLCQHGSALITQFMIISIFFSVNLTPPHHLDEEARFARAPDSDRGRGSKEESRNEEITPVGEKNNIR